MQPSDAMVEAGLTISHLQAAHIERQEEWCPDQKPDLSFRGNEMAGEVGEACNVIKKMERERHGWRGSRATKQQLAEELADVIHTAVLCAITAGIELEPAVADKFNATSEKNGLTSRIRSALVAGAVEAEPVAWRWRWTEGSEINQRWHLCWELPKLGDWSHVAEPLVPASPPREELERVKRERDEARASRDGYAKDAAARAAECDRWRARAESAEAKLKEGGR